MLAVPVEDAKFIRIARDWFDDSECRRQVQGQCAALMRGTANRADDLIRAWALVPHFLPPPMSDGWLYLSRIPKNATLTSSKVLPCLVKRQRLMGDIYLVGSWPSMTARITAVFNVSASMLLLSKLRTLFLPSMINCEKWPRRTVSSDDARLHGCRDPLSIKSGGYSENDDG